MLNGRVNEIDQKPEAGREVGDVGFSKVDRGKEKFQKCEEESPGVDTMQSRSQGSQSGSEVGNCVKILFGVASILILRTAGRLESFRGRPYKSRVP